MNKRSRWISIGVMVILVIGGAAGCMADASARGLHGQAPAAIVIWSSLSGKAAEALTEQCARIDSEQTAFTLDVQYFPTAGFADRVWNYQMGGAGPDLIITKGDVLTELWSKGALALRPSVPKGLAASEGRLFLHNDQVYALPLVVDVPFLYVRGDTALAPQPLSWEEFLQSKRGVAAPYFDLKLLAPWWETEGGRLTDESGMPTLNIPENASFFEKVGAYWTSGALVVASAAMEGFIEGDYRYVLEWGGALPALAARDLAWQAVPLAALCGERGSRLNCPVGVAVSSIRTSRTIVDAAAVIEKELLSLEAQRSLALACRGLPVAEACYEGEQAFPEIGKEGLKTIRPQEKTLVTIVAFQYLNEAWQRITAGGNAASELFKAQNEILRLVEAKKVGIPEK